MHPDIESIPMVLSDAEQAALDEFRSLIHSVNEEIASRITTATAGVSSSANITETGIASDVLVGILEPLKQFALRGATTLSPDRTVPLNETLIVMAHNAYNILGSGLTSITPNQSLSIPQLLEIGVRAFELDTYVNKSGELVLAHAICNPGSGLLSRATGFLFGDNTRLSQPLEEVSSFIGERPSEFVIFKLEDHFLDKAVDEAARVQIITSLRTTIETAFDPATIFTPADFARLGNRWPTIDEMVAMGKKVIFMPQNITQDEIDKYCGGLMFHAGLKLPDDLRQYQSVEEATQRGLRTKSSVEQMLEVVEDGTLQGRLVAAGRRIPVVRSIINRFHTGGGIFTPENLARLESDARQQGGGLVVGLDHIQENDPRLARVQSGDQRLTTVSGSFFGLLGNPLFCVPTVLTAAALSSRENMSPAKRMAIRTLISSCLPSDYIYLYSALDGTLAEFGEEARKVIAGEIDQSAVRRWGELIYKTLGNFAAEIKRRELIPLAGSVLRKALGVTPQSALATTLVDQVLGNLVVPAILHPVETVKTVGSAIAHPIQTATSAARTVVGIVETGASVIGATASAIAHPIQTVRGLWGRMFGKSPTVETVAPVVAAPTREELIENAISRYTPPLLPEQTPKQNEEVLDDTPSSHEDSSTLPRIRA